MNIDKKNTKLMDSALQVVNSEKSLMSANQADQVGQEESETKIKEKETKADS